jgi:hypothetical protein
MAALVPVTPDVISTPLISRFSATRNPPSLDIPTPATPPCEERDFESKSIVNCRAFKPNFTKTHLYDNIRHFNCWTIIFHQWICHLDDERALKILELPKLLDQPQTDQTLWRTQTYRKFTVLNGNAHGVLSPSDFDRCL